MRVLLATWAWGSHFYPLVPLGWALRAAGHEVVVASHPGFADTITAAGLTALPCGPAVDLPAVLRAELRNRNWRPTLPGPPAGTGPTEGKPLRRRGMTAFRIAADSADIMADDLVGFGRYWQPDLVVYEPMAFTGPLLARLLDVPAVRLLWTADISATFDEVEPEVLGGLAARLGLERIGALGDLTLDPCPESMQVRDRLPRQRFRYVPYNGPSVRPAWLDQPKRRPRVCATWGTSIHGMGLEDDFVGPLVGRVLGEFDVEVALAVVDEQLPLFEPLPANVIAAGRMPLHQVLPTCDAVIHQGGGGTTMTSVHAGIPQLIVPFLPDPMFNARQVTGTGAADHLWGADVTEDAVRGHIAALLSSTQRRQAAQRLAGQMRALPDLSSCLPDLEKLAATGSHPAIDAVAAHS